MKKLIYLSKWLNFQHFTHIIFGFICYISLILFDFSPVSAQKVNDPFCDCCCQSGVNDTLGMFLNTCPPELNDAMMTFNVIPTGYDPVDFYLYIEDYMTLTFVIDTFMFITEPMDINVCLANSCYQITMATDDSANVQINVLLDGELKNTYGPGYTWTMGGYGCCNDLNISVSGTDADCPNFNNGTAMVSVQGGKKPYQYNWEKSGDPTFVSTHTDKVENLTEGIYQITVTDAANCSATASVEIVTNLNSGLVINTNNEGPGSFRWAVSCADVITFDPAVFGETIPLTTLPIEIDRSIAIIADPDDHITIDASGILNALEFKAGNEVEIQGLHIISGWDSETGAIINDADLTLRDVFIYQTNEHAGVKNNSSGIITIENTVEIGK